MSLPRKLITLELNTKLENTVNRTAIPATRKHASNNWMHSTMLYQLQGLVCTVPEETMFNVTSLLVSAVNGRMTLRNQISGYLHTLSTV
jgi:hypothetical protein